ncbi:MAG: hypothetical protein ACLFQB_04530 [Chitinispirillaceae bacterium]
MTRYDLHVTFIPDHKAKLLIARSLANNPSIPLHVAMEMTEKPPLLLFKNIDIKEAEQHILQLKRFGIKFRIAPCRPETPDEPPPAPEQKQMAPESPSAPKKENHPTATPEPVHKESYSGSYARFRSGIMVGDQIEPKKESHKTGVIIVLGVVVVLGSLLFFLPKEKKFVMTQSESSFKSSNTSSRSGTDRIKENSSHPKSSSREKRIRSDAYLDSILDHPDDRQRNINFYKIAISFNKYNLEAWQGLLQTYRELGMRKEAADTRRKMEKVFGENIHSVKSAVERHGSLDQAYMTEDGIYRIEYRSKSRTRDDFLKETFLLTRAMREACRCEKISIYASSGSGRGMLVHSGPDVSVHSISEFSSQASITWLE